MKQLEATDTIKIFYNEGNEKEAEAAVSAVMDATPLIKESWGLDSPRGINIYITDSMMDLVFRSSPILRKLVLAVFLPLWFFRARRLWKLSAGWTLNSKKSPAKGLKPTQNLQDLIDGRKDDSRKIFIDENDIFNKFKWTACHELTHAFSSHLRLPMWLNEGLAMVTVDMISGKKTVLPRTLKSMDRNGDRPPEYKKLAKMNEEDIVYHLVHGYWITRYLEESNPGFTKVLLSGSTERGDLEKKISRLLNLDGENPWKDLDRTVFEHFNRSPAEENL